MGMFIPGGYIDIPKATEIAAEHWYSSRLEACAITEDESRIIAEHEAARQRVNAALTNSASQSHAGLGGLSSSTGLMALDLSRLGTGLHLSQENLTNIPDEVLEEAKPNEAIDNIYARKAERDEVLKETWERLKQELYHENLPGYLFLVIEAETKKAPYNVWGMPMFENAYRYAMVPFIPLDGKNIKVRGRLKQDELLDFLHGRAAEPIAGQNEPEQNKPASKAKRGRKTNAEAHDFWIELCRLQVNEDIPDLNGYIKAMSDWTEFNMKKPYGEETVRKLLSQWWKAMAWD
jgi:hypothetical protein